MSYGASDEVAEDFKLALEDLTMNSRYEISNLTVIAKENTEHALAISEALRDHIKKIAPAKKLPALYLLDSIAKNVGTPYTLFFGRQLYATFMESYALVDNSTRRKMEEMLKTWKEPVPGSVDSRPVFQTEVTRPIENALIKARTSAIQANQQNARSQHLSRAAPGTAGAGYRNSATPPTTQRPAQYPQQAYPPQPTPQPNQYPGHNVQQPYGSQQMRAGSANPSDQWNPQAVPRYQTPPVASGSWQQPAPQGQGYRVPDDSIDTLNSDIASLINAAKTEFAQNPYDGSIQKRLKALLDLQSILTSQKLPPDQIALIREQVKALSAASRPQPPPQPVQAPVNVSQPPAQPLSLASLLGGPNALAALLARSGVAANGFPAAPASAQPVLAQPQFAPAPYTPPVPPPQAAASAPPATSLLDQLRAAGLLPSGASTAAPPAQMPQFPPQLPMPPGIFPGGFPPPPVLTGQNPFPGAQWPNAGLNEVQLTPASLKIPRPHLILSLYENLGVPCTQCGRRFRNDEAGKKKKTAHMDWHFKVNQRMVEAEKRGQHRSWFVDELDWIKSREVDEEHLASSTDAAAGAGKEAVAAKVPKLQWLPVPDDAALVQSVCPICQEKFEMKWLDDAQEFVWMDAVKIGNRVYHASCHSEAKKDGSTPEPVLGKRKNEEHDVSVRTKIKTEA